MIAPLYCRKCSIRMLPDSLFCPVCGARQTGTDHALTNQPDQDPALFGTGRLPAGRMLNRRYRLVQTVGQGGMGAVYAAQDTQLGDRLVAVKEMSMRRLAPQEIPQAVEQFQREAYLLASLHHPNLPAIHEYFREDERWYLVMSFIEGRTLQSMLDATPGHKLLVSEVVRLGIELCDVLEYLHTHEPQVIFRDLKPLNIMLTPGGHICLIDFGIARHFKQEQTKDTAYYYSVGYAPPEQYGQSQTGPRSDIYSLGATLHQMLSGQSPVSRPFQFTPLQMIDPTIPMPLAKLVMQMLEMNEQARPSSATEVKGRLENILAPKQTEPTRKTGNEQQENVRRGQERSEWPGLAQKKDPENIIPGDKAKNKFLGIIVTSLCNILIVSLLLHSPSGPPGGLNTLDIQFLYLFVFPDILAAFLISARSIFVITPINCIIIICILYFLPHTPDLAHIMAINIYSVILWPIIAQISAGIILYLLARKPSLPK